jgi:heme-degrading monooxygenase HmoA
MTETYTSGLWTVRSGEGDAFVAAWKEFVDWARTMSGSQTFRLVRNVDRPNQFQSFAPWNSFEAQNEWKQHPEFPERIGRVRRHCENFEPATYELVAQVG